LGDHLDLASSAFDGFEPESDAVWMAEAAEESTHVWSHQARIALFLTAMRHFRDALLARKWTVHYRELDDVGNAGSLVKELGASVKKLCPRKIIMVEPGDWRVQEALKAAAKSHGVELEIRPDRHFLCSHEEFAAHAKGRKQLRMEFFYREMRRKTGVLMDGDRPEGGAWNYDAENRGSFGKTGPGKVAEPIAFPPDATTRAVLELVGKRFAKHPGRLAHFDWPATRADALEALRDFIRHRLPQFGQYQDAMWAGSSSLEAPASLPASPNARHKPARMPAPPGLAPDDCTRRDAYLFHSRLSAALNLKLLNPREVIAAAEEVYHQDNVPLASVEGFIRQILGWREYVRGIYWHFMPGYHDRNALDARASLPDFYWTGDTEMSCLRQVIIQTLEFGYAHHIQRLMIPGLYALLRGVKPQAVHEWYLAVYVDAVEWVELPNTLGMSQFADGGLMASKPYVASGKYIQRMSNYCADCRFDPAPTAGENACPFTTLYWNFLLRHEKFLSKNQRMTMQLKNLSRLTRADRLAIRKRVGQIEAGV